MSWWAWIRSFVGSLVMATAQLFAWLNRRERKREQDAQRKRVEELLRAAARPTREHADRLNRWLARGRSGRLRD